MLHLTHVAVRVLCLVVARGIAIYGAAFLYEHEHGQIENKLDEWWVSLDHQRNTAVSRHTAFIRQVAELLDHVIVLNECHLRRLVRDYLEYYHDDRIHDALKKEAPTFRASNAGRAGPPRSWEPRVGGLHQCYHWQTAA